MPLVDEQAERPAGAQGRGERGQRGRRVLDDLQDAVAEHHVGPAVRDQVGQRAQVALASADPVGDAALVGATREDGQRVGAGVDDHHLVAELGDPDREAAGASPDVEDGGRPIGVAGLEHVAQGVPHDRRAGGAASLEAALARSRVG